MQLDGYLVLGAVVVGLLVGMTGAGGGALMTPMLVLLFHVKPSSAISSDLVAAVVMRPFGAAVHLRRGTANLRLAGWMTAGSVPAAFLGAYLLHLLGTSSGAEQQVQRALGAALLAGAVAMALRSALDRRGGLRRRAGLHDLALRPALTVAIGAVGGVIVGLTSVGSGSLMIVLLLFAYPVIGASQLVGTDLCQAVPLTIAAAFGALAFGHVELSVTESLVIGSVPAVLVGSLVSSRAPDRAVRPVIALVVLASGLEYAGLPTTELGVTMAAVVLAGAVLAVVTARRAPAAATANPLGAPCSVAQQQQEAAIAAGKHCDPSAGA